MENCIFPEELIVETIENFKDDIPTLSSCSILCRALLPICRKHIFSKISLYLIPTGVEHLETLASFFIASPEIPKYVRKLSIVDGTTSGRYRYSQYETVMSHILNKLSDVREFRVYLWVRWSKLSWSMRSNLSSIFISPNLTTVSISAIWDIPIEIFIACSNVKHLRLSSSQIQWSPPGRPLVSSDPKRFAPESLWLNWDKRQCPLLINHPQSPLDLSRLILLDYHCESTSSRNDLHQIFEQCHRSLEDLSFRLACEGTYLFLLHPFTTEVKFLKNTEPLQFNFCSLLSLRRLKLCLFLSFPDPYFESTEEVRFNRFIDLLHSLPSGGSLEKIELIFGVLSLDDFKNIDWLSLDTTLHSLKQLKYIRLTAYLHSAPSNGAFDIAVNLPLLSKRCIIDFEMLLKYPPFGNEYVDPSIISPRSRFWDM